MPFADQVNAHKLNPDAMHSLPVHPTQLYSFAANLLICLILILVTSKVKIKGHLFSLYLMLYGVWRLLIEFLRDDQERHLGLSLAQYIAIGQFLLGVACWVYFSKKYSEAGEVNGESAAG